MVDDAAHSGHQLAHEIWVVAPHPKNREHRRVPQRKLRNDLTDPRRITRLRKTECKRDASKWCKALRGNECRYTKYR
jgi:hypothetical protein